MGVDEDDRHGRGVARQQVAQLHAVGQAVLTVVAENLQVVRGRVRHHLVALVAADGQVDGLERGDARPGVDLDVFLEVVGEVLEVAGLVEVDDGLAAEHGDVVDGLDEAGVRHAQLVDVGAGGPGGFDAVEQVEVRVVEEIDRDLFGLLQGQSGAEDKVTTLGVDRGGVRVAAGDHRDGGDGGDERVPKAAEV